MTFPVCGASQALQIDSEHQRNPPLERFREEIRKAYKCPCDSSNKDIDNSFRSLRNLNPCMADQSLNKIESIIEGNTTYLEFNEKAGKPTVQSKHLECPWWAFQDPIWMEVRKLISLKEHTGKSIDGNTDNLVYDAYLYYSECANKFDYYVKKKEFEKREQELKQSRAKQAFNNTRK